MNPFLIAVLLGVASPTGPAARPDVPIWPPISRSQTMDPAYRVVTGEIRGRLAAVDLRTGRLLIHTNTHRARVVRVKPRDVTLYGDPLSAEQYGCFADLARVRAFAAERATTERVMVRLDLAEDGLAPRVTLWCEPTRVVRPITLDEVEAILERVK